MDVIRSISNVNLTCSSFQLLKQRYLPDLRNTVTLLTAQCSATMGWKN